MRPKSRKYVKPQQLIKSNWRLMRKNSVRKSLPIKPWKTNMTRLWLPMKQGVQSHSGWKYSASGRLWAETDGLSGRIEPYSKNQSRERSLLSSSFSSLSRGAFTDFTRKCSSKSGLPNCYGKLCYRAESYPGEECRSKASLWRKACPSLISQQSCPSWKM